MKDGNAQLTVFEGHHKKIHKGGYYVRVHVSTLSTKPIRTLDSF